MNKLEAVITKMCMSLVSKSNNWQRNQLRDKYDILTLKNIMLTNINNKVTLTFNGKDIPLNGLQESKIREAFEICIKNLNGGKTDYELLLDEIDFLISKIKQK